MTDKLIEQIKADRKAGTPGKWEVTYERGCTHLMMRDHPNMESQMCDETYYPWVPENNSDWHRIARVPDMEARILADAKVIEAAKKLVERLNEWSNENLSDENCRDWFGHVEPALAAFNKALDSAARPVGRRPSGFANAAMKGEE